MSDKPETWEAEMEGRVKALEGDLAKAQTALAAREADVAGLSAKLAKHEEEKKARRSAEIDAYVSDLRKHGAASGSPISEEELGKVRKAFEVGHDDLGKDLGESFRSRSSALGGGQVRAGATSINLGGNDAAADQAELAEFRKRWGLAQQEA